MVEGIAGSGSRSEGASRTRRDRFFRTREGRGRFGPASIAAGGGPHGMRPTAANRSCRTRTPAVGAESVGGTPRSGPRGRRSGGGSLGFAARRRSRASPRRRARPDECAPEEAVPKNAPPEEAAPRARRAGSRDDGGSGRGVGGDGRRAAPRTNPRRGSDRVPPAGPRLESRGRGRGFVSLRGAGPGRSGAGKICGGNPLPAKDEPGAARRQSASAPPKGARKTGPDLAARSLAGCGEDRRLRIRYDSGRRRGPEGVAGALPVPFPGDTPHDADHRRAGPALRPDAASRAPRQ